MAKQTRNLDKPERLGMSPTNNEAKVYALEGFNLPLKISNFVPSAPFKSLKAFQNMHVSQISRIFNLLSIRPHRLIYDISFLSGFPSSIQELFDDFKDPDKGFEGQKHKFLCG